ncbi:hypothetical protein [Abyssalbus ytuae]|uniref:Uncharacterized protein n=1 Tax=Abyssalbus ytuae TaxID=2926907 RepID=A0A9E7CTS8_9FLAO|nr:hypothetical protein [Abyssalbus ytuae]UOB16737.1 hypothetical protein MQE35_13440 [Abyssalbus ytuae]
MNKTFVIPLSIKKEAETALSYYPQLKGTKIIFKFKKNIKKSTMQARPAFSSFFRKRKQRKYLILISEKFKISGREFLTKDVPENVLIGWLGHELGHITDYKNRSKWNLLVFGLKYLFSHNHIKEAERAADYYAVINGMEKYIIETKNFILNHADIPEVYKWRIKKFYLSPEEIMDMVKERDKDK